MVEVKKILSILLLVILLVDIPAALAEVDFSSMSNAEIEALIVESKNELSRRNNDEEKSTVFFDDGGI